MLVGVNTINLTDTAKEKLEVNLEKIKEIDMKVIGNIDSWLTDIYEQPSRFASELYSDSDQSMYAEQTLEILGIIKELIHVSNFTKREKVIKDNAIRGLQSAIEISGALVHLRKEHAKAILTILKEQK